jgi:hypothetical protein
MGKKVPVIGHLENPAKSSQSVCLTAITVNAAFRSHLAAVDASMAIGVKLHTGTFSLMPTSMLMGA